MGEKIKSLLNVLKNKALNSVKNGIESKYPEFKPKPVESLQPKPEPINITIPGKDGLPLRLPNRSNNSNNKVTAEDLYETFDPYGLATESAKILVHPNKQTYTPQEVLSIGKTSMNYGENPELSTGEMKAPNYDKDGNLTSYDYAPMRNNSYTVNGLLAQPYWKKALNKRGVHSLEDVKNSTKASMDTALMTLLRSNYDTYLKEMASQGTIHPKLTDKLNYGDWYAADPELRNR